MEGTIVRLMSQKRFGFIRGNDNKDYFFHAQEFNGFFDDLITDFEKIGRIEVTFDGVNSEKGPRASNVTRKDGGV